MRSITGAFTRPDARGGGVATALLAWLIDRLREDGYERCGVDLESFNPLAHRFWLRHFTPYTLGVVRRIDERIVRHILHVNAFVEIIECKAIVSQLAAA